MKNIVPITELQRQASHLVGGLSESDEPVIITQRGRAAAVIVSAARYAEIEADLERLDELELLEMTEIARGERAADKLLSHDEVKRRLNFPNPKRLTFNGQTPPLPNSKPCRRSWLMTVSVWLIF